MPHNSLAMAIGWLPGKDRRPLRADGAVVRGSRERAVCGAVRRVARCTHDFCLNVFVSLAELKVADRIQSRSVWQWLSAHTATCGTLVLNIDCGYDENAPELWDTEMTVDDVEHFNAVTETPGPGLARPGTARAHPRRIPERVL